MIGHPVGLVYIGGKMPRNRMIKVDFWADEKISRLSIGARLLFIGMWTFADDIGVIRGSSAYIRSSIFPYDDIPLKKIDDYLNQMLDAGLILSAEISGESFFWLVNFSKHQKINKPSSFRFIQETTKANISELFRSRSRHVTSSDTSCPKDKEKVKEKEKEKGKVSETKVSQLVIDVVNHLNQVAGKKYRHDAMTTMRLITSRARENYPLEAFQKVIDIKSKEWLGTNMEKFLRPETLFGNKFEGYYQETMIQQPKSGHESAMEFLKNEMESFNGN